MPYVQFDLIYRSRNFLEATGTIPTTDMDDSQLPRPPPKRDIYAREDAARRLETIDYEIEIANLRKTNAALRERVKTIAKVIDLTEDETED